MGNSASQSADPSERVVLAVDDSNISGEPASARVPALGSWVLQTPITRERRDH